MRENLSESWMREICASSSMRAWRKRLHGSAIEALPTERGSKTARPNLQGRASTPPLHMFGENTHMSIARKLKNSPGLSPEIEFFNRLITAGTDIPSISCACSRVSYVRKQRLFTGEPYSEIDGTSVLQTKMVDLVSDGESVCALLEAGRIPGLDDAHYAVISACHPDAGDERPTQAQKPPVIPQGGSIRPILDFEKLKNAFSGQ